MGCTRRSAEKPLVTLDWHRHISLCGCKHWASRPMLSDEHNCNHKSRHTLTFKDSEPQLGTDSVFEAFEDAKVLSQQ
jgi:hypothetical protein